ncbi:glycosyltransferase family 4 protein [Rummeliibacillus sp. TYF005]|uniref:glycosyltransferase family 4 protein n=1 Tax=Rummeliibacillus sp. TYF005 TaxID=2058214 RepID=UPI000F525D8B|nr:glycosyltransferase family 4 protein [Rummeliibacillus sp. TYF005]RPJ94464.1 glycosyltransferase WbuB [Rummeliibacillus sp. TYF005]
MNLLVICQYYYPEPFRITDICESLVEKGHDVTVLTGLPNYPEGKILENYRRGKKRNEIINGVKVVRTFEIGRGTTKFQLFLNYISYTLSASIKAFNLKEKFDVVLVNQLSPVMMAIPAIVYKKKYNRKILLYCLDLWPASLIAGGIKEGSIFYKLFFIISKWIYSSVDSIAVTSSMFKEYFKSKLFMNIENIQHIPQYAEDIFAEIEEKKENRKFNFVFAGNIGEMQSVETIVKAANEMKEKNNIMFHIVGDGSKLEECIVLSKKFKLNNIIFYGRKPINEMPQYYSFADAMLITLKNDKTISYTLPGKVQSYMAAHKPIIGSINGETRRVIKEAGCGYCCDADDYKELSKIILEFCDSNQQKLMGANGYDYYIKNYSKKSFISTLEESLIKLGG